MRFIFVFLVVFLFGRELGAQVDESARSVQTADLRVGRIGTREHIFLVEFARESGRAVPWDLGLSTGPGFIEIFYGGGYKVVSKDRLQVDLRGFLLLSSEKEEEHGEGSNTYPYFQPWLKVRGELLPRLAVEGVVYPYVPIGRAPSRDPVLEVIKVEYGLTDALSAGIGYGAVNPGEPKVYSRPLVSVTISPKWRYGKWELRLHPKEFAMLFSIQTP